ncbi:MAG: UDP-N-acetylmuramoyl-L-alanine--D-glutamate ligase [Simkaniaceae bacterium]|nr:MAG: UDP-N-acetylmuramoyl-L-alanine--D-glutamate ligase [Simkaniaceae bacterium]
MKALVIGLGISGRGAAKLLLKNGYDVIAVDQKPQEMEGVKVLPESAEIEEVDLTILSPGISKDHPQAKVREVIGEAELAMRMLKNRAIGITGTNGKTTLTLLLTHILKHAGIKARALGNVGTSIAEYACNPDPDELLVIELSSYQLETMTTRGFDYGIITNISPDHLDRYDSFDDYKKTKYRLRDLIKEGTIFDEDSYLQLTENERYWQIQCDYLLRAAWATSQKLGISWEIFLEGIKTFQRPPHRMERVRVLNGITFINDSKGTNTQAVLYGLSQLKGPVLLIAGGKGKGETFEKWKEPFQEKVRKVFAIGETAAELKEKLENVTVCNSLKEAVDEAYRASEKGETILLSPGAASFDQFQSYEERGKKFKEYVKKLKEKP